MYGFIHCCLEDMVLQLFGEPAWREILNVAGIKLRGASFLMHQVYDDETTFKLVAAASQVSGLPVEVCLEEFGKHFLVYCQKNGYDQILRVLGSNLYDFLTNLDNLHDHLASIYPGMRAPSFRVTRSLGGTGDSELHQSQSTTRMTAQQESGANAETNFQNNDNESHMSLAAGSMYLHYYSERKGLSPIVKGLVLAVAREFFSTDIVVTECKLLKPQLGHADDHVVLKIDRRSQADILLDEETSQAVAAAAAAQQVATPSPSITPTPTPEPPTAQVNVAPNEKVKQQQQHIVEQKQKTMLSLVGDRLSKLASDSLINSEIMMQTFPFHVIFDRHFNLVQVGSSLLRVTSLYWQRRGREDGKCPDSKKLIKFGDLFSIVRPKIEFTFDAIADHTNQVFVVKTRPLVLNADYLRSIVAASDPGCTPPRPPVRSDATPQPAPSAASMCPMNRLAMKRRSCAPRLMNDAPPITPTDTTSPSQPEQPDAVKQEAGSHAPSSGHHQSESDAFPNMPSLRLKGQMIILSGPMSPPMPPNSAGRATDCPQLSEPYCLYLCSPRVDHLDQLLECGVRMSDLALHDRARELMLMSHTHKEDRETVKKLDQATNDLKKMDTKLRQENKRTNEVLHNIFPAKIATLLSHGAKIESESFDPVTCLYSDIIGFTKMCGSENVRPIDIVRLLNTLYLQFDNLTNIHGVYKVETIGDAYVIVGGLPEPAEDHADRCVRMGLDMVKVIATVRSPADNQPIQMRIGIHSGPVMAGIVGIRVPRYSLFGNTTTLANQLETHGQGGKIHISEFTLNKLTKRDRFVIEPNPNQIPGFPFKTHFVTNYLSDRGELLEHEKILEEQLIRDFELMGNEVELVDDSLRQRQQQEQQHHHHTHQVRTPHSAATRGQVVESTTTTTAAARSGQKQRAAETTSRDDEHRPIVLMDVEEARSRKVLDSNKLMEWDKANMRPRSRSGEIAQAQQVGANGMAPPPPSQPSQAAKPMDLRARPAGSSGQKRRQLEQKRKMPSSELVEMSIKLSDEILSEAFVQYGELRTLERLLALLDAHRRRISTASLGGLNFSTLLGSQQTVTKLEQPANPLGLFEASSRTTANGVAKTTGSGSCPLCLGAGQLPEWRADELHGIKLISAAVSVALASIGSIGGIKFPTTDSGGGCGGTSDETQWRFNRFLDHLIGSRTSLGQAKQTKTTTPASGDKLNSSSSSSRAPEAIYRQQKANVTTMIKTKTTTTGTETPAVQSNKSAGGGGGSGGSSSLSSSVGALAATKGDDALRKTMRLAPNEPPPLPPPAAVADVQTANEQSQYLADGLGQLLANLRQERERLSCQVGRLELRLSELELELEHANHDELGTTVAPSRGSGGTSPVGLRGGVMEGARQAQCATRSSVLKSSNSSIQRMKRMDTLKRRKIKREQQQLADAASLPASPAGSSTNACDLSQSPAHSPIRPPRPPPVGRTGSGLTNRANDAPAILESDAETAEQDETEPGPANIRQTTSGESRPTIQPGPAQIYQTVRSSLASLLSESNGQQSQQQQQDSQQQQKRKRFSLSAFGTSFSAALSSPFSSPKKVPLGAGITPQQPVTGSQQTHRHHRGSASGSQSTSSSAVAAGARAATTTTASRMGASQQANSNNCSCLRSSGSSQSVESAEMR